MITRQQRETIGRLIASQATAMATLQQADLASEFKANAAFDYVRASYTLEAYPNGLVEPKGKTAAAVDGWITWGGDSGGWPTRDGETLVEVKWHDGRMSKPFCAKVFDWRHLGVNGDIVAYRIVK